MTRVFFDVNVILDVLADRLPFAEDSGKALGLAETRFVEGIVAAHTMTTLHYLLERDLGTARTRKVLADLLRVVGVASVDDARIRHALALGWRDFEDALQSVCAEQENCDYLVTRDKVGFKKATTRVVTPGELLALL
ncbi:MAG: PIN domain-containing protein [Longimicrobiales bacterium]